MIHAVGDSHAVATFAGIPEVATYHLGPVTMHRAGKTDDPLLQAVVSGLSLESVDVPILCFGEIDVRCHINRQLEQPDATLETVIHDLVKRYITRATSLNVNDALVAVLAVVPPVSASHAINPRFPVVGTDEERAAYTVALNRHLTEQCTSHGVIFVDVYTPYHDKCGMLRSELSDGCVHLRDPESVRHVLTEIGILT